MQRTPHKYQLVRLIAVLLLPLFLIETTPGRNSESMANNGSTTSSYIVQASSTAIARDFVIKAGGTVIATLNIIDAVGAELSEEQIEWLRSQPDRIRIFNDGTLEVSVTKRGGPKTKKQRDIDEDRGSPSNTSPSNKSPSNTDG